MSLQQLKQEIRELPDIGNHLKNFKEQWVSPIRKGQKGNKVQISLHSMHPEDKKELNRSLKKFYSQFNKLEEHSVFVDKLQGLSHALVQMKLLSLRGAESSGKMKYLQNTMLEDPHLSISTAISEIKTFDEKLSQVETMYHDINGFLHQNLSLEHSVALADLPHYVYLNNLKETAKTQKRIVKKLGHEFVSMQRKLAEEKKRQKRASA